MKKICFLLIHLFFVINVHAQEEIMTSPDVNISSTGTIDASMRIATGIVQDGRDITAKGTLKIPIVFVKFADDIATTAYWPTANVLPTWAATFVDDQIPSNNIYQYNNFSKFYNLSSGGNGSGTLGEFQVIGNIYFVNLTQNRSFYTSDGQVSEAVLDTLDDPLGDFNVDFTEYDNWEFKVGGVPYTHVNNPDGILDFMIMYWKDSSITVDYAGGRADLGFSGTITKDGINIASSNGVTGFKSEKYGLENTIWVSAHEVGHHQFGITSGNIGSHFNGRADGYGDLQRFGLMTTGEGHQFSAYERYRLGWLDPITASGATNPVTFNDTHTSSTNNAIIIPIEYNSLGYLKEYYLLENYHTTNAYSGANPFLTKSLFNHTFSKGIIVYHVSEENFDWPTLSQVDMEEAEGLFNWEVIQGASTPTNRLDDLIAKGSVNVSSGFDERGRITAVAGTSTYTDYMALTPSSSTKTSDMEKRRYNSNDWLGDQEDLFGLAYNEVFTKWSNPSSIKDNGSDSNVGFQIVGYNSSTHQYTINVATNSTGIQAFAPSKPQNFKSTFNNNIPSLTWVTNGESDFDYYEIWKLNTPTGSWAIHSTTSSTNYTDNSYEIGDGVVEYKIKAVDLSNKKSVYSNSDKVTPPAIPQNLSITWYDNHPKLTWDTNSESNIQSYKIWKYAEGSSMIVATVTHNSSNSTHTWIDNSVTRAGKFDPVFTYSYKVKAIDNSDNESLYSNQVSITGTGGIWKLNDDEIEETVITEYVLNSNYPNPFNPTTQISYQIPENSFVNLVIYNSLGQEVATLVNQHQAVGRYEVNFNASNLPSGVYIYKLQANAFSSTKKMMLTK